MKKVTINPAPQEIDWSKPQWVQNNDDETFIILTNGEHMGNDFSGTALPCRIWENGEYDTCWAKNDFHLLTTDIPFIISNKD